MTVRDLRVQKVRHDRGLRQAGRYCILPSNRNTARKDYHRRKGDKQKRKKERKRVRLKRTCFSARVGSGTEDRRLYL